LGALVGLLLVRPESQLLHAQMGSRARRGESPGDDTFEAKPIPPVGQRLFRLDRQDLAVDTAPGRAEMETVAHDRVEVALHEPLLDQVRLRQRAPDLFRRMSDIALDNDGKRFGCSRSICHWSILLRGCSRCSNRLCQNPVIWLVQSINGARAPSCAL